MTPWMEMVHEALLDDGLALTASEIVQRFGEPPEGEPDAGKQLREAKAMRLFERPSSHSKHKGGVKYRALDRAPGAPTASEYLRSMGPVRSVFEIACWGT